MKRISAKSANYIKLGRKGDWEQECLNNGILRFGYDETPHDLCLKGDWDAVQQLWRDIRGDEGAATRDANQIRTFYEAGDDTIFVTFSGGLMHWCRPAPGVQKHPSGRGRLRRTIDGWSNKSLAGELLTTDRLSGRLLKKQQFQGTICSIDVLPYLLRKINDELSPEVAAAEVAERALIDASVALMRLMTWQDFELLVELVFSSSGWRRIGITGRTQKMVDLELVLPTTGERAFVQVKSAAKDADLRRSLKEFAATTAYDRMFFVWHTGRVSVTDIPQQATLIDPEKLGGMVLDAGLSSWLRDKVS